MHYIVLHYIIFVITEVANKMGTPIYEATKPCDDQQALNICPASFLTDLFLSTSKRNVCLTRRHKQTQRHQRQQLSPRSKPKQPQSMHRVSYAPGRVVLDKKHLRHGSWNEKPGQPNKQ